MEKVVTVPTFFTKKKFIVCTPITVGTSRNKNNNHATNKDEDNYPFSCKGRFLTPSCFHERASICWPLLSFTSSTKYLAWYRIENKNRITITITGLEQILKKTWMLGGQKCRMQQYWYGKLEDNTNQNSQDLHVHAAKWIQILKLFVLYVDDC